MPLISMEIYFWLNAKVLLGNAAVLSVSVEETFTGQNNATMLTGSLKQLKDFILKNFQYWKFLVTKAFLN